MKAFARIAVGCALAGLSAVLLTLSFAPYDAWPLVWVGFVPMVVARRRILPPRWAGLANAIGVGGFVAGLFAGMFPSRASWYMKALPLLVAGAVFLASRGERKRAAQVNYARWPLEAAMGWVAVELVRLFVPALGTWGFLGYALYRQTWFLQPVAVVGIFGLDLLIVVTNYAIALLVLALLDARSRSGSMSQADGATELEAPVPLPLARRWCAGAFAALAIWSGASLAMRHTGGTTVRVAALQPGRPPNAPGATPAERDAWRDRWMLGALSEQTRRASAQGARVVVWPEAALVTDPQIAYKEELAALAREAGAYLFVGYRVASEEGQRNEALAVAPDGSMLGTYGKDHPVGFLGETSLTRGTYPTYATPFGPIGAMICADIDFTDTTRTFARRGAKILAVPSADWLEIGDRHYVHAVFRALESGAAVVKSEFSRDSAIVDGSGAIVASTVTPQGSASVLVADVALHTAAPPAARVGDAVGWLSAAGLFLPLLARLRTRRAPAASRT